MYIPDSVCVGQSPDTVLKFFPSDFRDSTAICYCILMWTLNVSSFLYPVGDEVKEVLENRRVVKKQHRMRYRDMP